MGFYDNSAEDYLFVTFLKAPKFSALNLNRGEFKKRGGGIVINAMDLATF